MVGEILPAGRDLDIIRLVGRLQYLTSAHIHQLIFHNTSSLTPCKRALLRLTKLNYLQRTERRPPGGSKGGSAQYVYRLGHRARWLFDEPPPAARRDTVDHTLGVADCFAIVRELQRDGLPVHMMLTEPDSHRQVGGRKLEPDLFIEFEHKIYGFVRLCLEIDMDTQRPKRILNKMQLYIDAWHYSSDRDREAWAVWPRVPFVAVNDGRARELEWMISQLPEADRPLFMVTTRPKLRELLTGAW